VIIWMLMVTSVGNSPIVMMLSLGCSDVDKPSHVAFGTKIPIPDHVLKSRMVCSITFTN